MALVREILILAGGVGRDYPTTTELLQVRPLTPFFQLGGSLDVCRLGDLDGECTRRELLARFLILSAVLDQGPDIIGVRLLAKKVTDRLYEADIRFLHEPESFFENIATVLSIVDEANEEVSGERAEDWAADNQSTAGKYNLFLDNSRQTLNYVVFRWGTPLSLPMLQRQAAAEEPYAAEAFCRFLWSFPSAEEMSRQVKDHRRFGLGKCIGDKAAHLFAKWAVSTFAVLKKDDPAWGGLSYEIPLDSNVGRVLWRTGCLLEWADEEDYEKKTVIRPGQGKGGTDYIRATQIRGMKATAALPEEVEDTYRSACCDYLCCNKRPPRTIQIQRLINAYLLVYGAGASVANVDDGLIHIGTHYCWNHSEPACDSCPLRDVCRAAQGEAPLIENYRT